MGETRGCQDTRPFNALVDGQSITTAAIKYTACVPVHEYKDTKLSSRIASAEAPCVSLKNLCVVHVRKLFTEVCI